MHDKIGGGTESLRFRRGLAGSFALLCAWGGASGSELAAPVATAASNVTLDSFSANWNAADEATGYCLDLYSFSGVPPTTAAEGFDAYPDVTPDGWIISNKTSDTVYGSGGALAPSLKLQETGHAITTPVYPAAVTRFSFWCRGYSVSNSSLRVEANAASVWSTLENMAVSNSAMIKTFYFDAANGYTRFRLVYAKDRGNVAVDDVCASYGDAMKVFILSDLAVANATSYAVANVTPGVYYYSVQSTDGVSFSPESNVIMVDTTASPVPPVIEPVEPQTVRVGEALTFSLNIRPTDGDPVTVTNAWAQTATVGAWGLSGGVFSFVPAAEDAGERRFAFSAADKDGESSAVAVTVTVRRAQIMAVSMTGSRGDYFQDFDALPSNGMNNVWDNAAEPLEAWRAFVNASAVVALRIGTGSGASGGLYSFGAELSSFDRSLGSLASAGNTCRYGVAFTNMTGLAVTNITVGFTAEQWRVANGATNTLVFEYCITNRAVSLNQGIWCRVNALCFDTPLVTNAVRPCGAVHAAAPRSATLSRPVFPGDVILLRWSDVDDAGNDHAFGIDDLRVSWAAGEALCAIPVGRAGTTETFDEMGYVDGAELPFLWRAEVRNDLPRGSGAYSEASDRVMNKNAPLNFAVAGSYVFASRTEGDYAVGGLSETAEAKSVTLFARFLNDAGVPVRRWDVRYAVEKYRDGMIGCAFSLLSSRDGATWTVVGPPTIFPADEDSDGFALEDCPCMREEVDRLVIVDAPVEPDGIFYLAWRYAVAEGEETSPAQALGIDDVRVSPAFSGAGVLLLK